MAISCTRIPREPTLRTPQHTPIPAAAQGTWQAGLLLMPLPLRGHNRQSTQRRVVWCRHARCSRYRSRCRLSAGCAGCLRRRRSWSWGLRRAFRPMSLPSGEEMHRRRPAAFFTAVPASCLGFVRVHFSRKAAVTTHALINASSLRRRTHTRKFLCLFRGCKCLRPYMALARTA